MKQAIFTAFVRSLLIILLGTQTLQASTLLPRRRKKFHTKRNNISPCERILGYQIRKENVARKMAFSTSDLVTKEKVIKEIVDMIFEYQSTNMIYYRVNKPCSLSPCPMGKMIKKTTIWLGSSHQKEYFSHKVFRYCIIKNFPKIKTITFSHVTFFSCVIDIQCKKIEIKEEVAIRGHSFIISFGKTNGKPYTVRRFVTDIREKPTKSKLSRVCALFHCAH